MPRMKYTVSVAMGPIEDIIEIAKTAEDVGFDAIALPDSLFYMESQAADYPYTPDGSRMWNAETPWVEKKKDSLKRYADIHIHSGWQD
ncbi:hypothetical protein EB75_11400 [Mycobacterium sp. ST-F2]|nr:hypothetical protein EB75_11400 [Mycobacterium sp. ST-F2]